MLAHHGILAQFEELEPGQKDALKKVGKLLGPHIEATLQDFYSKATKDPELSVILAAAPSIGELIQSQRKHWEPLLAGEITDDLRERSGRIGAAHARVGVLPTHYIAAYSYILEAFIGTVLGPKSTQAGMVSALVRVILIDLRLALTNYHRILEDNTSRTEASALASSIEPEVKYVKRVAGELAQGLNQVTSELAGAISDVKAGVEIVEGGSAANSNATQSVAAALSQIQASNAQVGGRADEMSQLAGQAAKKSRNLGLWLDRLRSASHRISEITKLIDGIAKQTNLLALNATIEAGRAGKAGTGFAVVASEIKELSQHSAAAAKEIAQNISGIQADLNPAIAIMDEIGDLVQKVDTAAKAVSDNVSSGIGALDALGGSAEEAAKGAAEQRNAVGHFTTAVANASKAAESLGQHAQHVSAMFEGVSNRLSVTVASVADVEDRLHPPVPVRIPVSFKYGGSRIEAATLTLSEAGCLVAASGQQPPEGAKIELEFSGIGSVTAEVARHQPLGMRIRFIRVSSEVAAALGASMSTVLAAEERLKKRLGQCCAGIEQAIAQGIARGRIAADAMFDDSYQPVRGTNPLQVRTAFLPFLEEILPPLQEPVLQFDKHVVFCAAVDRNGYLPVHNAKYSKPQGADPVWNHANCRNRRMFDDKTGLTAARNEQEFLTQFYPREMGGGRLDLMRDISTPIVVAGRHWGALRMGAEVPALVPLQHPAARR